MGALQWIAAIAVLIWAGWKAFSPVVILADEDFLFEHYRKFASRALGVDDDKRNSVKMAVGANACLDLIVSGTEFLKALGDSSSSAGRDHAVVGKIEEFIEVFTLYAGQGKAAERFVTDNALFRDKIVAAALKVPSARFAVGGNAALMAAGSVQRGLKNVLLGGIVGERLRALLPSSLQIVGPSGYDDQIHLIIEYRKGDELWPGVIAPRANRFIVSADTPNAKLEAAQPFFETLQRGSFDPDVVVFSGFHLLDGISSDEERTRLLRQVDAQINEYRAILRAAPLHLEFASIGDKSVVARILEIVVDKFDSIGCNEEELYSLYHAYNGEKLDRAVFSHAMAPSHAQEAIEFVMSKLPSTVGRLHFHTLGLHVIAIRSPSDVWKRSNELEGVLTGALVTSLRVCGYTDMREFGKQNFEFHMAPTFETLSGESKLFAPGASWKHGVLEFFAALVPVCKNPRQTVGAGDSISAAALVRSVQSNNS